MEYEWDPAKSDATWADRQLSFKAMRRFEWETALEWRDVRQPYPEVRTAAIGFIGARLHVVIYVRRGSKCRVMSLRRAKRKEIERYVEHTEDLE